MNMPMAQAFAKNATSVKFLVHQKWECGRTLFSYFLMDASESHTFFRFLKILKMTEILSRV